MGQPPQQLNSASHQVSIGFPAHLSPAAPNPAQPAMASAPPAAQPVEPEKATPWKFLPPDKCPYRNGGKCLGPEACLSQMDQWGQARAIAKFKFSEKYGSPKSPKEAHVFYLGRKLSQLEEADDKKLDLWIRKCRECAFHKTLDHWDDSGLDDGDEQTSWSRLV